MNQLHLLSGRTAKEILRDPLTLFFGLGFPLVLLSLLTAIQANIPEPLFALDRLAPGVSVFSLSFLSLFSALLLSKDRGSALLLRLYTTPLRPVHYVLSYMLPLAPIALLQALVCYGFALILGLSWTWNLLLCLAVTLPVAWIFIALGLFFGSLLSEKQVGGVCGALLTNLTGWLSGVWFDVELVGGAFLTAAKLLPFYHGVALARAAYAGTLGDALPHLWVVLAWAAALTALAVWAFLRQMRRN